jgi:ATP-dependent protease ClpP protease subunit
MEFPKYLVINKSDDEANIDIFGDIGESFFSESFSKQSLQDKFKEIGNVSKISVNISSFGGSLNDGIVIYDLLREHPAKITTKVYGMTASAATVIAQAGNERLISENAMYLVHQPMILTAGNINDHKENIELLESAQEQIINIYNKRTKKSKKELRELLEENNGNGKWITAKEAVEFGFADSTFEPSTKGIKNFSKEIMNQYKLPEIKNENMDKTFFEMIDSKLDELKNLFTSKPKEGEQKEDAKIDFTEIENSINQVKQENTELTAKVEAFDAEKLELSNKVTSLQAEIERLNAIESEYNKLNAKGTKVDGVIGEENIGNVILTEEQKAFQELREKAIKAQVCQKPVEHGVK